MILEASFLFSELVSQYMQCATIFLFFLRPHKIKWGETDFLIKESLYIYLLPGCSMNAFCIHIVSYISRI